MKIAYRRGHNYQAIGAAGLINEVVEADLVTKAFGEHLKSLGHETLNVTPGNMDSDSDLAYGVSRANAWGADLFISIHFNKAFNSYSGALGTETWVYSDSDNIVLDEQVAARISNALAALGFNNRGVKENTQLYELKACKMASVIVEVCFVEATEDVALYKRLGPDKIGQTIAYAISDKKVDQVQNAPVQEQAKEVKKVDYIIQYSNATDNAIAEMMADRLNCPTINCLRPYAFYGQYKTVIAVGEAKNRSGYTNVLIQGKDREETMDKAIEYCKSLGK